MVQVLAPRSVTDSGQLVISAIPTRLRVLHSSVWTCPELSTEEAEKLHEIDGQAKNVAKRE